MASAMDGRKERLSGAVSFPFLLSLVASPKIPYST